MIADKLELLALLEERERRQAGRKLWTYYPDEGPLRRDLYGKHMQFFAAGLEHRERAAVAANRVGKSEGIGAYEVTLHLTGLYPDWWPGYRFDHPTNWLCGGDTSTTTRDVPCRKLFGPVEDRGTGMIPRDTILGMTTASGVPGLIDIGTVRHASGGNRVCQFSSYDQGRAKWQGTERDGIWLDEEPPMDIYTEALIRTMTTRGMVIATFTPLSGLTDVALSFLPNLAPVT